MAELKELERLRAQDQSSADSKSGTGALAGLSAWVEVGEIASSL
jgi:hypothetical protein